MSEQATKEDVRRDFDDLVNLTAGELKKWLGSDESRSVGMTSSGSKKSSTGGGESVGHDSGRRIVAILEKKKSEVDDDDVAHMRKVVGYIRRHLAQRPQQEDLESSRWRYSLLNWGHDPLKG